MNGLLVESKIKSEIRSGTKIKVRKIMKLEVETLLLLIKSFHIFPSSLSILLKWWF